MKPVIHIQPTEGWGYYVANKKRLVEELVEIASNEETNTSVYMTEEDNSPYIYVYRNDQKIFQSACRTAYETERNLRVIFAQYIIGISVVMDDDKNSDVNQKASQKETTDDSDADDDVPVCSDLDAMSEAEFNDYVDEREEAIYSAVYALIEVLTEDDASDLEFDKSDDECIDNIVDHIVEYLAIDCGFRIRRPMTVVEDESGLNVRTEYPYEEFDFRDDKLHK